MEYRDGSATAANLFFTPFPTCRIGTAPPVAEKGFPTLFGRLEAMTPSKKSITPGKYLLAIYGDNFIGRSSYSYLLAKGISDPAKVSHRLNKDPPIIICRRLEELCQRMIP